MAEKKKILIIDDEPDVRTFFATLLEDAGYDTFEAENGQEASAKIEKQRPDLITLDISMPETSGVRCYRNIKENEAYRDIPVIIITGISEDFEKFISTRRQVPSPEGYLTKPIDQEELLATVARLLS